MIDRLAGDLRNAFPEMKGFSSSNLKYMRFFVRMCPDLRIGQQPADQLPWFHLVAILIRISDDAEREWYAAQTIEHDWSRPTLDVHIKNQLHRRQEIVVTNFDRRLPALVLSNTLFNEHTGLAIVCPLTNTDRGFPFHVPIINDPDVTGFVMVEQVKSIDFSARKAKRIGRASDGVLEEVLSILDACIY